MAIWLDLFGRFYFRSMVIWTSLPSAFDIGQYERRTFVYITLTQVVFRVLVLCLTTKNERFLYVRVHVCTPNPRPFLIF